jgi:hypothetical protein
VASLDQYDIEHNYKEVLIIRHKNFFGYLHCCSAYILIVAFLVLLSTMQ